MSVLNLAHNRVSHGTLLGAVPWDSGRRPGADGTNGTDGTLGAEGTWVTRGRPVARNADASRPFRSNREGMKHGARPFVGPNAEPKAEIERSIR